MRKGFTGRTAQEALKNKHNKLQSWAEVSRQLDGLNRGLLSAIARGKKKAPPSVLRALGLSVTVTIEQTTCQRCGKLHQSVKRCYRPPLPITRWRDLPIAELRRAIENRKDYR